MHNADTFVRRPVQVEAVHYREVAHARAVYDLMGWQQDDDFETWLADCHADQDHETTLYLDGGAALRLGQWVVRDPHTGHAHPIDHDDFTADYQQTGHTPPGHPTDAQVVDVLAALPARLHANDCGNTCCFWIEDDTGADIFDADADARPAVAALAAAPALARSLAALRSAVAAAYAELDTGGRRILDTQITGGHHDIDLTVQRDGDTLTVIACDGRTWTITGPPEDPIIRAADGAGVSTTRYLGARILRAVSDSPRLEGRTDG
ncbi:hypothetical protein [Dietzia sp. 179-F 9C3 NHS]|uniref:hypothetical protein n=1 Tax=Dietzia sp. 179-F 9C3 NHS TaxID=3374295 RepID=UPI003879E6B0